jgi:hypothetical protein
MARIQNEPKRRTTTLVFFQLLLFFSPDQCKRRRLKKSNLLLLPNRLNILKEEKIAFFREKRIFSSSHICPVKRLALFV